MGLKNGTQKKWSTRGHNFSSFQMLKTSIKRLLKIISGNDTCSMLRDVLTLKEKSSLQSFKTSDALRNIGSVIEQEKPKKRHRLVRAIKDAGISHRGALESGLKSSSSLWYIIHFKILFNFSSIIFPCRFNSLSSNLTLLLPSPSNLTAKGLFSIEMQQEKNAQLAW